MRPTRIRTRRRDCAGALAAATVLLAGCGDQRPRLDHADAARLISLANAIQHEEPCAQARDIRLLKARAAVLVSERRVPTALERQLVAGIDALSPPLCLPTVPAVATTETPAPPQPHGHPRGPHRRGRGHAHGHGKHR